MSSFHIVCKKSKGLRTRNLKVLILSVLQKIRAKKERRMKLLRVQLKKKPKESEDCFFCKKPGHIKKECTKYHVWNAMKGIFFTLICSEVNLASVPKM